MDNAPAPAQQEQRVKFLQVRAEDYREVYVDSCSVDSSFFTFVIRGGRMHKDEDIPNQMINEHQVALLMSPEHAKALSKVLAAKVTEYEQQVGPIREGAAPRSPIVVPNKRIIS